MPSEDRGPAREIVYPPWPGMQHMRNTYDGRAKLPALANDRFGGLRWTGLREVLSTGAASH